MAQVTRINSVIHGNLVRIQFNDGKGITCTKDHPIHVDGKGWCSVDPSAEQRMVGMSPILPGDSCVHLDAGLERGVTVTSITMLRSAQMTFNLTTSDGAGNYFAGGILVSDESFFRDPASRIP